VDRAVERDERVDGDRRLAGDRVELTAGILARDLDGVALGELVDVGDDDLEGDAELLEDRPPLGAAAR
jgi:hypothetical protein